MFVFCREKCFSLSLPTFEGRDSTRAIARQFQFFGFGSVLGSCFRVKNLPRFLHRFLEPVLEPSLIRFSVFYEESRFFLGIPNFCLYSSIFLDFLGLFVGSSRTGTGRSTVVSGRSTMVSGRCTMVSGRSTMVSGRSTMVSGRSTRVPLRSSLVQSSTLQKLKESIFKGQSYIRIVATVTTDQTTNSLKITFCLTPPSPPRHRKSLLALPPLPPLS